MTAIYKREMRAYFTSPIGYVFMALMFGISAFMFMQATLLQGEASSTETYFNMIIFVFLVTVPLITMKLISEERKMKTEQLLLTAPINVVSLVCAKFFAAMTLFGGIFTLASLIFYIPLTVYGTAQTSTYFCNVLAILLIGAAFIAIGIFISSLTENQFISALGTIAAIGFLLLIGNVGSQGTALASVTSFICVASRYVYFANGIFDWGSLVYYVSLTGLFLFLTVRVFENRRWAK